MKFDPTATDFFFEESWNISEKRDIWQGLLQRESELSKRYEV